jgi:hypothetical protein
VVLHPLQVNQPRAACLAAQRVTGVWPSAPAAHLPALQLHVGVGHGQLRPEQRGGHACKGGRGRRHMAGVTTLTSS